MPSQFPRSFQQLLFNVPLKHLNIFIIKIPSVVYILAMILTPLSTPIKSLTAFKSLADLTFDTHIQSISLFKQQFISVISFGVMSSSYFINTK